jgi:hypothetical protein
VTALGDAVEALARAAEDMGGCEHTVNGLYCLTCHEATPCSGDDLRAAVATYRALQPPVPTIDLPLPAQANHPHTSHEAARLARPKAMTQRGRLLYLYARHPEGLTTREAYTLLGSRMQVHIISTRVGELESMGWLRVKRDASGEAYTRLTESGAPAQVYEVDPAAEHALDQWMRAEGFATVSAGA